MKGKDFMIGNEYQNWLFTNNSSSHHNINAAHLIDFRADHAAQKRLKIKMSQ